MKKIILTIAIVITLFSFAGCDSYLDRQPDEALTTDMIFTKESSTRRYLTQIYGYYADESNHGGKSEFFPWQCCSDEMSVAYKGADRPYSTINRNTFTPASNAYLEPTYSRPYEGIRQATFFMQNVHKVTPVVGERKVKTWKAEARFLRAMYYFIIMKTYGPCILLGEDEMPDYFAETDRNRDRDPWDACVNFVVSELDKAAEDLPIVVDDAKFHGSATKGAAMAVKSRLLLYSARPLFNGCNLYKNIVNNKGEHLFPQTPSKEKWRSAAQAAKDVIDLDHYKLYGESRVSEFSTKKEVIDVLRESFVNRAHEEHIFTRETSATSARSGIVPSYVKGTSYGGVGPTQKLVDAFAMGNGRYPISGYTNNDVRRPIIDPSSSYSDNEFVSNWTHPESGYATQSGQVLSMYADREPRFYLNVFWSSLKWTNPTVSEQKFIEFFVGGNSSYNHNYSTTGYLTHKFHNPKIDTSSGFGMLSVPIYRYAEILLNYAEALNEYDPGHPDILYYLNKVRQRAGMPNLEDVYSDITLDQEAMRKFILRERNIELCYEGHRYFDTRTWMTSNLDDHGPVIGMNIHAPNHNPGSDFWTRTQVKEEGGVEGVRVFTSRKYLMPIPQMERDRVNITQNYGW